MQAARAVWLAPDPGAGPAESSGDVPPLVAQILRSRDLAPSQMRAFIAPSCSPQHAPDLLCGMRSAVERILRARDSGEQVVVYGDCDVDGITAVAVLVEALAAIGIVARPYIPDRQIEPAGVQRAALLRFVAQGSTLVITADCGVASAVAIDGIGALGLDCIVTDHHMPAGLLPQVVAVIDPLRADCPYPFKDLAGVGVAYKLAQRLLQTAGLEDRTRALLDLVAIGTIADMVPLTGENRTLTRQGLSALNKTNRPGLQCLVSRAGLRLGYLSAMDVGCKLAPLLNAAGRNDHGSLGYLLLTTPSYDEAAAQMSTVEQRTRVRQALVDRVLQACHGQIDRAPDSVASRLIVVEILPEEASVAGIVSGKLAKAYGVPVMAVQRADQMIRGTLRGTSALPILEALQANVELLEQFGGHRQAAGFIARAENQATLTERLRVYLLGMPGAGVVQTSLRIDAEVPARDIGWSLYQQLQILEPFGVGNPRPLLLAKNLRLQDFRRTDCNNLQMSFGRGSMSISAIAFQRGDLVHTLRRNQEIDIVFSLEVRDRDGDTALQVRVHDLALSHG